MAENNSHKRPIPRLALNRAELAISIGVSTNTVDLMVQEGFLPPAREWHTRKLWLVSEVEAHLHDFPSAGVRQKVGRRDAPQPSELRAPQSARDPIREHYDRIGFDPITMNEADYSRLYREAEQRWRASIPGTPLGKLERTALSKLSQHPVGQLIAWNAIKGCGPLTAEKLEARGLIEIRMRQPDRFEGYVLKPSGMEAAMALVDVTAD